MLDCVMRNSVVVANQVNPSIFSQLWLVNHNLIAENEFGDNCIFTPHLVQVETNAFSLVVLPDRIQFAPANVVHHGQNAALDVQADTVRRIVGGIVSLLPHTPYTAVGLNFTWLVLTGDADFAPINRRLLRCESPIADEFDIDDARFGAYFSKNILDCRLKLDIKPVKVEGGEAINLTFNFSRDLPPVDSVPAIQNLLDQWPQAFRIAESIAQRMDGAACG